MSVAPNETNEIHCQQRWKEPYRRKELALQRNACLFHGIFYGIQVVLVAIAAVLIFSDVDPRIATLLELEDTNLYDGNPGLSFRPMAEAGWGTPRSIISYKMSDQASYKPWVRSLEKFVEVYMRPGLVHGRSHNLYRCDYNKPPPPGGLCDENLRTFSACIPENYFSYHKGTPCVFLKLNVPPGWKPVFYNDTSSLPETMPLDLRNHITNLKNSSLTKQLNTIWVSCEGENPADVELMGPIELYPTRGFPGYNYLYTDVEGYLSPIMAIHFQKPTSAPKYFEFTHTSDQWRMTIQLHEAFAYGAWRRTGVSKLELL